LRDSCRRSRFHTVCETFASQLPPNPIPVFQWDAICKSPMRNAPTFAICFALCDAVKPVTHRRFFKLLIWLAEIPHDNTPSCSDARSACRSSMNSPRRKPWTSSKQSAWLRAIVRSPLGRRTDRETLRFSGPLPAAEQDARGPPPLDSFQMAPITSPDSIIPNHNTGGIRRGLRGGGRLSRLATAEITRRGRTVSRSCRTSARRHRPILSLASPAPP
jgi:hypothetical protein